MKKILSLILLLIVFASGCSAHNAGEKEYYTLEDFSTIEAGKSTIEDVLEISSDEFYMNSSLGLFAQYPMEDGKYILVVFILGDTAKETLVHSISVTEIDRIPEGQEPIKITDKD